MQPSALPDLVFVLTMTIIFSAVAMLRRALVEVAPGAHCSTARVANITSTACAGRMPQEGNAIDGSVCFG